MLTLYRINEQGLRIRITATYSPVARACTIATYVDDKIACAPVSLQELAMIKKYTAYMRKH